VSRVGGEPRACRAVEAALRVVPRGDFLPPAQGRFAALDLPLPIGLGQTSSQPSAVRRMLELLDVRPGHRVLDVGSGSGWTTALLAWLAGPSGSVVGVEIEPSLATWGRANLEAAHLPWARVEDADPGRLGWPRAAPYDRILVSAEASDLPEALMEQLAGEAVMVLPVAGRLLQVRTSPGAPAAVTKLGHYRFVPLR
jgi:protein-L-isoaspartate(D-aspartate) O-methyltransferase